MNHYHHSTALKLVTLSSFSTLKIFCSGCSSATNTEECYPDHEDWKRTEEQVSEMSGKQKTKLSKRVGDQITKEQFENEMPTVFNTLVTAWELAY